MTATPTPPTPDRPASVVWTQRLGMVLLAFGVWLEAFYDGFMLDWRWWVILGSVIAGPSIVERLGKQ